LGTSLLVTGGAGFIGSHTLIQLIENGYDVTVFDSLANSSIESLRRIERISGKNINFVRGDICSNGDLEGVFRSASEEGRSFDTVIHFAGLKAVGDSVSDPLAYYSTNVNGTLNVLHVMDVWGVKKIIFSSSATVYGESSVLPYGEGHLISPTNPYGRTKAMVEQILSDWVQVDSARSAVSLRYFNPIGAHESGLIGESPNGRPNNLFPFITQVAVGKQAVLDVFGSDYDTVDGTGVRDYIHVMDVGSGHVSAVRYASACCGYFAFNLGTGRGTSVMELVKAFEATTGRSIPIAIKNRRPGDIAVAYADVRLAQCELNWRAVRSVEQMCSDGWRWQSTNANGYDA